MTHHPRSRKTVTGEVECPDCGQTWDVGDKPDRCVVLPNQLPRQRSQQAYLREITKIRDILKK